MKNAKIPKNGRMMKMQINQIKVNGFKQVVDTYISFSAQEMQNYAFDMGFRQIEGGSLIRQHGGTKHLPIHGWFSINQLQADNHTEFMGIGRTLENREEMPNGIFYKMKIDEKGEGKSVNGTISYEIVGLKRNGKIYQIDTKKVDNVFTTTYGSKSAKNSTLMSQFIRVVIKGGFCVEMPTFAIEAKAAPTSTKRTKKDNVQKQA